MNPYLRISYKRPSSYFYAKAILATAWPEAIQEKPVVTVRILEEWPFGVAQEKGLADEPNVAVAKAGLYYDKELIANLRMMKFLQIKPDLTFKYRYRKRNTPDGEIVIDGIPEALPRHPNRPYIQVFPKWLLPRPGEHLETETSLPTQIIGGTLLAEDIITASSEAWYDWEPKSPSTFEQASNGITKAINEMYSSASRHRTGPARPDSQITLDCQEGGKSRGEKAAVTFAFWNLGGFTDEKNLPVYTTAYLKYFLGGVQHWVRGETIELDPEQAIKVSAASCIRSRPSAVSIKWKLMELQQLVGTAQKQLEEKEKN